MKARRGPGDYIMALLRGIPLGILGAVIGGLAAYLIFGLVMPPRYTARTGVYLMEETQNTDRVGAETAGGAVVIGVKDGNDREESPNLAAEGAAAAETSEVLEAVISQLKIMENGNPMPTGHFRRMVSAEAAEDQHTVMFIVKDTDPKRAADIANVYREVSSLKMAELPDIGEVRLISEAKPQEETPEDDLRKKILIGAAVGFLLALILLTIFFMDDDRIRTGRDAERLLEIEVIGNIPFSKSETVTEKSSRQDKKAKKSRQKQPEKSSKKGAKKR